MARHRDVRARLPSLREPQSVRQDNRLHRFVRPQRHVVEGLAFRKLLPALVVDGEEPLRVVVLERQPRLGLCDPRVALCNTARLFPEDRKVMYARFKVDARITSKRVDARVDPSAAACCYYTWEQRNLVPSSESGVSLHPAHIGRCPDVCSCSNELPKISPSYPPTLRGG
ncbi:hypothetical protein PsYK624_146280 [Phanerochaete sordida]|uniref:Uncharacterized protein n=1 Tax=Phanerochaete sordida TaxID=48140 RepID=A0A9P3GQB0_9APHY|nr:hypothetical protein PsYK624_146280 [Phanerochaete sordida]